MLISHLMPVDVFSTVDLQRSCEWELKFGSATPAPRRYVDLPDRQCKLTWQHCDSLASLGILVGRYLHHGSLTIHATKLPSTGNQNIQDACCTASWHTHICRQDMVGMHSISKRWGDLPCPSALTHKVRLGPPSTAKVGKSDNENFVKVNRTINWGYILRTLSQNSHKKKMPVINFLPYTLGTIHIT